MADKLVPGDSLNEEVFNKFNGMADEVNALKESGGAVELTKEAITDALGYTPSEPVKVNRNYTNGRFLADIQVGDLHNHIYSPYAECIEDVLELPDREGMIDDSKIYRVTTVQSLVGGVKNQMPNPSTWLPDMLSGIPITIHHVETLPENPEYATDSYTAPTKMVFYYLVSGEPLFDLSDNRLYAYIPVGKLPTTGEELSNTWQRASTFLVGAFMMTDKGVITSEDEATSSSHSSMYFLADIELYHYRNGWQKVSKGVTEEKVSEMIEEAVAGIPSGGSTVSVTQTLTSGTKIGEITVDGETTALYAPEGGGSGGSGGSGDSGMTIKQITFTDRPSLWEWLQSNYTKILKTVVSAPSIIPIPLEFSHANAEFDDDSLLNLTLSSWFPHGISDGYVGFTVMYICIYDSYISALLAPKDVVIDADGLYVSEAAPTDLADAYWSAMSISMTIYYMG